jgi:hypothetical protein
MTEDAEMKKNANDLSKRGSSELSKTQAELLEAMKNGVACWFMPYMGSFRPTAYYYRDDTGRRCTAPARALLEKGLVEIHAKDWRGHKLIFKKPPCENPSTEPIIDAGT